MQQLGYSEFTRNKFTSLWKDQIKIDKDNTQYGYKMYNGRYVWIKFCCSYMMMSLKCLQKPSKYRG